MPNAYPTLAELDTMTKRIEADTTINTDGSSRDSADGYSRSQFTNADDDGVHATIKLDSPDGPDGADVLLDKPFDTDVSVAIGEDNAIA